MATDIVIPNVGESVTEGVIAAWTKADGEYAEQDETVLELETDKITMELPAPASGVVRHAAAEGDTVAVGATVGRIEEGEKPGARSAAAAETATAAKAEPGRAAAGAPAPGPARVAEGRAGGAAAADPAPGRAEETPQPNGELRATPLAQRLAAEHGVDLSRVRPTGPGHRVREQDVLAFVQAQRGAAAERPPATEASRPPAAPAAGSRQSRREKMTPLRQRIAQRLVEAQQTAAMLTTFNEVDMQAVMDLRKRHKETFEKKHGIGLGFMSFFVKAAVGALRAYPTVNAYIVEEGGKPAIEHHDYCDVAIAVSTPKGLTVPVVRNAETLGFAQIESAIRDFAARARDGKLGLEEITGGTFTITNGGIFGSMLSTPILNPPQSAILGMHAIKNRAVENPDRPGEIVLRPMMFLALSYDHRIVDGAEAVSFLRHIKESLEDPARLLLDM